MSVHDKAELGAKRTSYHVKIVQGVMELVYSEGYEAGRALAKVDNEIVTRLMEIPALPEPGSMYAVEGLNSFQAGWQDCYAVMQRILREAHDA